MDKHYLVGGVFDDLRLIQEPYVESYIEKDPQSLIEAVRNIVSRISTEHEYPAITGNATDFDFDTVFEDIVERGKSCIKWCRVEKYYCIVISRDFYRPYIWSKDCEPELVNWKTDETNEKYIENAEYEKEEPPESVNINPVIRFLSALDN
jgi:hypothetical protein